MNRKGFAAIIFFIVVLLIVAGVVGYFAWKKLAEPKPQTSAQSPSVPISSSSTQGWQTYTNQQYGFSVQYPSYLYVATTTCQGVTVCIQSANEDMELGGAIPDSGTFVTTGYQFVFNVQPASGTFDINTYLATQYADSELDTLSSTTIDGQMSYMFTFKDEEGGGDPIVVVPHGNEIISIAYSGRTDAATFSSSTALFNQVVSTIRF